MKVMMQQPSIKHDLMKYGSVVLLFFISGFLLVVTHANRYPEMIAMPIYLLHLAYVTPLMWIILQRLII